MVSESLTVNQPVPTPAVPAAQVELYQDSEGQGSPLPVGRAVTGVVAKLIEQSSGQFKYELTIQDLVLVATAPRSYPVGTVLDLLTMVGDAGGVRLAVRGTEPVQEFHVVPPDGAVDAASRMTTPDREAPSRASVGAVLEEQVARALRRAGVTPERAVVERVALQIREQDLVPQSAARAAARLLAAGIPPLEELVRGGALVETSPASLELGPAVSKLIAALRTRAGGLSGEPQVALQEVVRALQQGAGLVDVHGEVSVSPRARPEIVLRAMDALVKILTRGDAALVRVREELSALQAHPESRPADLQARTEQLLRSDAPRGSSFEDLGGAARGRALEMLHDLERGLLERHPELKELRFLIRDVHHRLEATTYAQLVEWMSLEDPEQTVASGLFGFDPGRFPFRITIRDQRDGNTDGSLRFVIEVESRKLGRVHVTGELDTTPTNDGRKLSFHMGSEESETKELIEGRLGDLVQALREQDYDPRLTVGRLPNATRDTTVDETPVRADGLDVKV